MSNPSGQQADFFGTKVSIPGINVNQAGDNQLILKDDYNSRIYYNANGVPTVLLGRRSSTTPAQYGFYVSKNGVDVTQASDSQLVFNSGQDVFKVVSSGVASGSTSDSAQSLAVTINHNLNYVPSVIAYVQPPTGNFSPFTIAPTFGGGWVQLPFTTYIVNVAIQNSASTGIYPLMSYYVESNSSSIIIRGYQYITGMVSSSFVANFKYFILQETASQ
jgi:hypothetical protein